MLACGTFGADLNCSESRWGAADPSCAATWTIAHTDGRSAALRDCRRVFVRYGSQADFAASRSHVRFTPESGQKADMLACPLCAKSGHLLCSSFAIRSPPWRALAITNRGCKSSIRKPITRLQYGGTRL